MQSTPIFNMGVVLAGRLFEREGRRSNLNAMPGFSKMIQANEKDPPIRLHVDYLIGMKFVLLVQCGEREMKAFIWNLL
jgi:hypothetical protein